MTPQHTKLKRFWLRGEPWVWATSAALSLILFITLVLVGVVAVNGLSYFWPARLAQVELADGTRLLGQLTDHDVAPNDHTQRRLQYKVGNRDLYGQDFRWINAAQIKAETWPADAVMLERQENGKFFGFLASLQLPGIAPAPAAGADLWPRLLAAQEQLSDRQQQAMQLRARMGDLSQRKEELRRKRLKLDYERIAAHDPRYAALTTEEHQIDQQFITLNDEFMKRMADLRRNTVTLRDSGGREKVIALVDVVRLSHPNAMGLPAQLGYCCGKIAELLLDEPREANTEGGLFPAIFGTVLMVMLMSVFCIPLGVIAAIYLREYAKDGPLVRIVRIAVNNLAGVPSIVYGVFGLGFFVYGVGAALDRFFYPYLNNSPVFGTGGILWASLTLALLTVPVVIVATEESLAAVPRGIREGSLALGATKFQTLVRILLPLASPGIMTGLILAMARAAGEVAPLMIVGVVKSAPALPLDAGFPFLHLDRKFMHLAFAIFDSGFQSPNVEAARPMVYVTTLLLLLIVVFLSAAAIVLRNRMRRRYSTGAF
jgi:phosphate transport system permease protein